MSLEGSKAIIRWSIRGFLLLILTAAALIISSMVTAHWVEYSIAGEYVYIGLSQICFTHPHAKCERYAGENFPSLRDETAVVVRWTVIGTALYFCSIFPIFYLMCKKNPRANFAFTLFLCIAGAAFAWYAASIPLKENLDSLFHIFPFKTYGYSRNLCVASGVLSSLAAIFAGVAAYYTDKILPQIVANREPQTQTIPSVFGMTAQPTHLYPVGQVNSPMPQTQLPAPHAYPPRAQVYGQNVPFP